jgi:hypothetical protein
MYPRSWSGLPLSSSHKTPTCGGVQHASADWPDVSVHPVDIEMSAPSDEQLTWGRTSFGIAQQMAVCPTDGYMSNNWLHVQQLVTCPTVMRVTCSTDGYMSNTWLHVL